MRKKKKIEKTTQIKKPNGDKVEIVVPNMQTLRKYKMGDSNFRVCGWCNFGTGQQMVVPNVGACWISGRCSLIPLPLTSKGLMPPVKIQNIKSRNKLIAEYKKFNDIEKRGIHDFNKRLETINNMLKTVENTGNEYPENMDWITWNTECIFVRSLANKKFKNEIFDRTNSWMEEFKIRIGIRNQYIRELKGRKKVN